MNNVINQLDLTDIYSTLDPKRAEYIVFSSAHGTFYTIDHSLGHKTNLNKFKEIAIIQCIFFNHNGMKLESNRKGKLDNSQICDKRREHFSMITKGKWEG